MPITFQDIPILSRFFCAVETQTRSGMSSPKDKDDTTPSPAVDTTPKKLPKGVVLGPDGKPCRSCTSFAAWAQMTKKETRSAPSSSTSTASSSSSVVPLQAPPDCPPDVDQLGRSSWTLLHTLAASYPEQPSAQQQADARSFIGAFSRLYPCYWCATDFQDWMKVGRNAPRVSSRSEFGLWLCEAHNSVNEKLGKEKFDCGRWEERWRTGWGDGRCD